MTQQEFYQTPQVVAAIKIQQQNPHGSIEHRRAHKLICQCADYYGVTKQFKESNGHIY